MSLISNIKTGYIKTKKYIKITKSIIKEFKKGSQRYQEFNPNTKPIIDGEFRVIN